MKEIKTFIMRAKTAFFLLLTTIVIINTNLSGFVFIGLIMLSGIFYELFIFNRQNNKIKIFSFLYSIISMISICMLKKIGNEYIALVISIGVAVDTLAYISGSIIRGPKIVPKISPKKTVSGSIIGVFCGTCVSYFFIVKYIPHISFPIKYSFLLALSAFFGDLMFSYIKRKINIKDFSNLIPGHGGILDRMDSIFLIANMSNILNLLY